MDGAAKSRRLAGVPQSRSGRPMIYAASLGELTKESPFLLRDWVDADSQGRSLERAISLAFLTESSEGCAPIEKSFKAEAAERKITIVTEES